MSQLTWEVQEEEDGTRTFWCTDCDRHIGPSHHFPWHWPFEDCATPHPATEFRMGEDGNVVEDWVTCGECGLTWNDALPTTYTPAPSGRCPNELGHA